MTEIYGSIVAVRSLLQLKRNKPRSCEIFVFLKPDQRKTYENPNPCSFCVYVFYCRYTAYTNHLTKKLSFNFRIPKQIASESFFSSVISTAWCVCRVKSSEIQGLNPTNSNAEDHQIQTEAHPSLSRVASVIVATGDSTFVILLFTSLSHNFSIHA